MVTATGPDKPAAPERHAPAAAYRAVVELRSDLLVGRRPHLLTLLRGEDRVHLDLEGRLHRAWMDGASYQRGLDGRVRRVWIERRGDHRDRWLHIEVLGRGARSAGDAATGRGGAGLQQLLERVAAAVAAARAVLPAATPPAIAGPLERAAAWDAERYAAEGARFDAVYDPIPILPPDQGRALVVQATTGCSWNRCTFCHLYRDVRFRAKPAAELRAHLRGALGLVGRALALRTGVFIGQANALCIEPRRLRDAVRVIREALAADGAGRPAERWPLGSFIDSFTRRRGPEELRELRRLGLRSVALGLESGSEAVLEVLGKPAEVEAAIALVRELHEADITCGVIVLVGAGGHRHAAEHVARTAGAIARMRLGRRDRVYLSPLHVPPGSEYERQAAGRALGVLARPELVAQAAQLRGRLRAAGLRSPIALYDIRRFIY